MTDSLSEQTTLEARELDRFLEQGPYTGYCYSYPHKTAWRDLPARALADVWNDEAQDGLFLYLHVPFCEFRCGFCNLFTLSQPDVELPQVWLSAFDRQAKMVREQLPNANVGQMAIGGGTPTYLNPAELEKLFGTIEEHLSNDGPRIPVSMEVSPATVDADRLRLMKQFGVDRVSMGVQSFDGKDLGAMGRPQKLPQVFSAIDEIHKLDFPILNLDLIYGADGQTEASWLESVRKVVRCNADEIYLYPLYVRELTGLRNRGSQGTLQDQHRLDLYRIGRDLLLEEGYEQVSMRMFRRPVLQSFHKSDYRCQEDGMLGLGCGARSYTSKLHYGSKYGVRQKAIGRIIQDYVEQTDEDFAQIRFGFELDEAETRRRHVILSLFLKDGLCLLEYRQRFGADLMDDFAELSGLLDRQLATLRDNRLCLSEDGLAWSDTIGPWLYSANVQQRMEDYAWKDA